MLLIMLFWFVSVVEGRWVRLCETASSPAREVRMKMKFIMPG
jgi:hypothetical protein